MRPLAESIISIIIMILIISISIIVDSSFSLFYEFHSTLLLYIIIALLCTHACICI